MTDVVPLTDKELETLRQLAAERPGLHGITRRVLATLDAERAARAAAERDRDVARLQAQYWHLLYMRTTTGDRADTLSRYGAKEEAAKAQEMAEYYRKRLVEAGDALAAMGVDP